MIRRATGTIAAGVLAILPFLISIWLIFYIADVFYIWFGPESRIGRFISGVSGGVVPIWLAYIVSIIVALLIIWMVGHIARGWFGRLFKKWFEMIVSRIPLINTVYQSVDQITEILKQREAGEEAASSLTEVVFMRDRDGLAMGLLSSRSEVIVNNERHFMVFVPSSPIPTTGSNYLVPECNIIKTDISAKDLTRTLVSLGALGPGIINTCTSDASRYKPE